MKHSFHILDLLKRWQKKYNLTIFAIVHDLNVASLYADKLALLNDGRIARTGDVELLKEERLLQKVYDVEVKAQPHPDVPKPQLLMSPGKPEREEEFDFTRNVQIRQEEAVIHIAFSEPLRTISNGVIGNGLQWLQHFCNFYVHKNYDRDVQTDDMEKWLINLNIQPENALGIMTAVPLQDAVFQRKTIEGVEMMVMVTAGVGNAVDISNPERNVETSRIGTINIMVFLHQNLTDSALVNACMSATEAKTKAVMDSRVYDGYTNTLATGTSTDSLVVASTQIGEETLFAGSGTAVGQAIGQAVYEAAFEAINTSQKGRIS